MILQGIPDFRRIDYPRSRWFSFLIKIFMITLSPKDRYGTIATKLFF